MTPLCECGEPQEAPQKIEKFAEMLGEASKQSRNTIFLLIALSVGIAGALLFSNDLQHIERRLEASKNLLRFLQGQSRQIAESKGPHVSEGEWMYKFDHLFETEEDVEALVKELKSSGVKILSSKQSTTGFLPSSMHRLHSILVAGFAVLGLLLLLQLQLQREHAIISSVQSLVSGEWTAPDALIFCMSHVLVFPGSRVTSDNRRAVIAGLLPFGAITVPAIMLSLCAWQAWVAPRVEGSRWVVGGVILCWLMSLFFTALNLGIFAENRRSLAGLHPQSYEF